MIQLKFVVTEEALEVPSPPEAIDPAVILETAFVMPVSFTVDGVNILGFPGGATMNLSVVGFAVAAMSAVERLKSGGCEKIDIASAGDLFLQETSGTVKFWTTTLKPDVQAPYDETVAAFRAFASEVQRVIEARVPEMRKHPYWPRWFPGRSFNQWGAHCRS